MKLPFLKGKGKGSSSQDEFDALADKLSDGPDDDLEAFGGGGTGGADADAATDEDISFPGDQDEPESGGGGAKRWIILGAVLTVVLLGGAATGYFLVAGGDDEAPDVAAEQPVEPAPSPVKPPDGVPIAGATLSEPIGGGGGNALMAPPAPADDRTAKTDKSTSRRPWLQLSPDAAQQGGAPLPGVIPSEITSGGVQVAEQPPAEPAQSEQPPAMETPATEAPAPEPERPTAEAPAPVEATPEAPGEPPAEAPTPEPAMAEQPPAPGETMVAERLPTPEPAAPPPSLGDPLDPPMPTPPTGDGPPRPPLLRDLDAVVAAEPLEEAPLGDVTDDTPRGPMPVIGPDGERAWQLYAAAAPAEAEGLNRIAIIVTDLGLMADPTQAAIDKLPAEVTLEFSPYARDLQGWIAKARAKGHEVLVGLPMEPANFPGRDPGPYGLLTILSEQDNLARTDVVLSRGAGYVGVMARMGERFLASGRYVAPVLEYLSGRGVLFVDNGAGVAVDRVAPEDLPMATVDLVIDEKLFRQSIDARLRRLAVIADTRGRAVATISARPVSMLALTEWAAGLRAQGAVLAPVSTVVGP